MDKNSARNSITSADLSSRDIAHSIYLATVQGVSGANQTGGMGFALSAIAELWNIRGVVGNPNAKTKITGRYRGMNVTEQMILNVISKYSNGFNGSQPLFDDLLGVGVSGNNNNRQSVKDVYEKVDVYAILNGWDKEPEKTYQDGSQSFSGRATRYSDSVIRGVASLSVIVALDLVKSLTGRDLSNSRDDLTDYAISILRKMGF